MSTLTLAEITSLLSGVVVTGNQSPQNTHIRDAINAFGIPEVWRAVLKATNYNPTSNADVAVPLSTVANPIPTYALVTQHMAASGWSALKIVTSIDSDYLVSNPAAITEIMSLKTIALANGSTTTYGFTSTPVFSSIWDLLWQFKCVFTTNTGTVALPVAGAYTAPTPASGFLDITDPSTAWKQVSNGTSGIISDADIGKFLHLYYVNAQSNLATFMGYITNGLSPTTPVVAYSTTILNLGGWAAAVANVANLVAGVAATPPTATAAQVTAAKALAPYIASLELAALAQYKVICVYKTINNFFDASYPWQQLIFTNTLLSSIKVKYNITANQVALFVGPSGTSPDGTFVAGTPAVPKVVAVPVVTASPGVAGVAAVNAVISTAVSQIPSIRTTAQIADGLSLHYLSFYVLNSMTYTGLDCVSTTGGIRNTIVSVTANANDFDSIFSNFIGSYSLIDRLSLLATTTGLTPSPTLLKGTDSADSIANVWSANNGASAKFVTVPALAQTTSTSYSPVAANMLVIAAIRNNVVGWSGSNSKTSSTFGASGFTHNSYIPSSATYTSDVIVEYASLYYIDTVNNVATVTSRGIVAPFNSLSGPTFTPNNGNLIIQSLTNNSPTRILGIQIGAESNIRLAGGAGAGASDANAQEFLTSLSDNSVSAGYTYNDILDYPASPAFNSKPAVQIAMEATLTNPSKLNTVISYAKDSAQRLANVRTGFNGLTLANKNLFVSNACKMGTVPSDLFMLISSDDLVKAQTLYNAMASDTGGAAGTITVSSYKQYLTSINFTELKKVFVDGGVSGTNAQYPVLGKFGSPLPAVQVKNAASAIPNEEWFIAFNDAAGIANLKSIGALPPQLFTWTKPVKVFDPVSGILSTPVDAPQALIYKLSLVKEVYGLSDSHVNDALEAAGIRAK
jgi:hypothetical protein